MTIKNTIQYIRDNFKTISVKWIAEIKEYKVTYKRAIMLNNSDRESAAYYTSDAADAIATAREMHNHWGNL